MNEYFSTKRFFVRILLACSLLACNDKADKDIPLSFTVDTYPRVDGSTSAHPLGMLIACKALGVPCKWAITADSTYRIVPDAEQIEDSELADKISQMIVHSGTHSAYMNLIQQQVDLILVARRPSEEEQQEADNSAISLDIRPIALDAFVFILNQENPVNGLSVKQIQDIYTGKITHWNEVGGASEKINAYQRDENSGSQELMKTLVMKDLEMIDAPDLVLIGMMGPINAVSQDRYGIGYSVYFYEQFMAPNEMLKLCAIEGSTPNKATISARSYQFTTEVYAAVRADTGSDHPAVQLRDWLFSSSGKKTIEESGYVPAGG